jgi:hypothetical protein
LQKYKIIEIVKFEQFYTCVFLSADALLIFKKNKRSSVRLTFLGEKQALFRINGQADFSTDNGSCA